MLTVALRDADAVAAIKGGKSEVTGHFTYDPYRLAYEGDLHVRPILQSRDVVGGVGTVTVTYATTRFHNENPKTVAAYYSALVEADDIVKRDPMRAARIFKTLTKSTTPEAELKKVIRQSDAEYSVTPVAVSKFASFMARIGTIKRTPGSWRDLFFPEAQKLAGS